MRVASAGLSFAFLLGPGLLVGCAGETPTAPAPGPSVEAGDGDVEARAEERREAEAREAEQLLPLDAGRVLWYRATTMVSTPEGPKPFEREVALFTSRLPKGDVVLELTGAVAAPWDALALGRGPREVLLLGDERLGRAVVRSPDATWDKDRGRRLGWEQVGEWRALRTEHGRDPLVRLWLARDVGVVKLEVVVKEQRELLLELLERGPRGPPGGGYDASSPGALWRSLTVALRRLDVDAFERLLGPGLRRRERRTGWDQVRDLVPDAELRRGPVPEVRGDAEATRDRDLAARVHAEAGDLLALDVHLRGAWQPNKADPSIVSAPAIVTQLEGGEPFLKHARVILRRGDLGWVWEDVLLDP